MAEAKNPTAILFDFDGVIVDSESLHHRAYELALAPYGLSSIPFHVYADRFSNRGVGLEYCAEQIPGLDVARMKQEKDRWFRQILEKDARLLPGVESVLRSLSAGRPMAIATGSSREAAKAVLGRFGLTTCFQRVIGREDYGRDKPAPDAFLRACDALGEDPARCLAVEDSLKGMRAACEAGIPCVVVPNDYTRGGDFASAAAILSRLDELTPALAEAIHARAAAG
jgi:HAD superfamily hydrolase (TIGR01509 family)